MLHRFSAFEILKMAEQIERNGWRFYRHAADKAQVESARRLFLDLAERELDHEKVFAAMREALPEKERQETIFDPEHDLSDYLDAWADGHVFGPAKDPLAALKGEEDLDEILRVAIELEKDSILFYLGMKDVTGERLGRNKIDEIIREEMRHVGLLSKNRRALHRSGQR